MLLRLSSPALLATSTSHLRASTSQRPEGTLTLRLYPPSSNGQSTADDDDERRQLSRERTALLWMSSSRLRLLAMMPAERALVGAYTKSRAAVGPIISASPIEETSALIAYGGDDARARVDELFVVGMGRGSSRGLPAGRTVAPRRSTGRGRPLPEPPRHGKTQQSTRR